MAQHALDLCIPVCAGRALSLRKEAAAYAATKADYDANIAALGSRWKKTSEQFWMYLSLSMAAPQTFARTFTKLGRRLY